MIRTVQYFADFRKKPLKRAGVQYGPGFYKDMHKLWCRKLDPWSHDHFRGQLLHGLCASKVVQVLENPLSISYSPVGCVKVLPWVVEGAGGLGAGKTSGAGTRGVDLNAAVGGRTGYTDTNGGESSNNGSKIHVDCYPAENPSL